MNSSKFDVPEKSGGQELSARSEACSSIAGFCFFKKRVEPELTEEVHGHRWQGPDRARPESSGFESEALARGPISG